jgi:hypothetical protein
VAGDRVAYATETLTLLPDDAALGPNETTSFRLSDFVLIRLPVAASQRCAIGVSGDFADEKTVQRFAFRSSSNCRCHAYSLCAFRNSAA